MFQPKPIHIPRLFPSVFSLFLTRKHFYKNYLSSPLNKTPLKDPYPTHLLTCRTPPMRLTPQATQSVRFPIVAPSILCICALCYAVTSLSKELRLTPHLIVQFPKRPRRRFPGVSRTSSQTLSMTHLPTVPSPRATPQAIARCPKPSRRLHRRGWRRLCQRAFTRPSKKDNC